jgi:PEP-CTERM motif
VNVKRVSKSFLSFLLSHAPNFRRWEVLVGDSIPMRSRALRLSAALLTILCLTGIPAQAEPVAISHVVQVLNNFNGAPDLQLRNLQQNEVTFGSDGPQSGDQKSASSKGGKTTDSLISGVTIKTNGPTTVEVIDQGDVEGTICDCGELFVAGGGFPKWPFFFLAAIPLFFINSDCETCDSVTTTPTPTPTPTLPPPNSTPTPVPEPASLMLLASGLAAAGAAIRRRRTTNAQDKEEN